MKIDLLAAVAAVLVVFISSGAPVPLTNAGFATVGKDGQPAGWSRHANWRGSRVGHNGSGGFEFTCSEEVKEQNGPGQDVILKPGRRYRFSITVRTEKLTTVRKSPYKGISLYLVVRDASGKRLRVDKVRPCTAGTKDWTTVDCLTTQMPTNAAKGRLVLAAVEVTGGRACVDNVYLEEMDDRPIDGIFSSAYRNEATGGEVKFLASLFLDPSVPPADYSAVFSYRSADGKTRNVPGAIDSSGAATAMLDVSLFAMGTNDVACTLSAKGRRLGSASIPFVRLSAPPARRVWIDSHKRTIVDGKPFFPFGMYFREVSKKFVDIYAEGPFNCLATDSRLPTREELDYCQSKGIKVIYNLRNGIDDKDSGEKWVREKILEMRDHPALLAWYICDELPLAYVPRLRARRGWAEALDPDHPTWTALNKPDLVRYYMGTFDVLGLDRYPIPKQPVEKIIWTTRAGESSTRGTCAAWQIPQAFAWGWLKRRETRGMRAPTQREMASMSWQWIAGGANGLVYYAFKHLYEKHQDPNDAFAPAWARTKAMAEEVWRYAPVFLSIEKPISFTGATETVAARTWRYGGRNYLLAVNCTVEPQKATLELSEQLGPNATADLGVKPKIDGRRIELDFGPMDYVMLHD